MSEKMQLVELLNNLDHKILTFATYKSQDLIDKSIIFTLGNDGILIDLTLTSDSLGMLHWENGEGITKSESWDNPDSDIDNSLIDKISKDVLPFLDEDILREYFERALQTKNLIEPLEISFE